MGEVRLPESKDAVHSRRQVYVSAIGFPACGSLARLLHRHGDKILLVEVRQYGSGPANLLVVVDLDQTATATEIGRVSSRAEFTVGFLDRVACLAMRRLATAGLLRFTHEPRVLHRSAAIPKEAAAAAMLDSPADQVMREAERSLQMAKVLAAGGFPEEAPGSRPAF
jgi:hypothetical protein